MDFFINLQDLTYLINKYIMKKYFFLFMLLVLLFSCDSDNEINGDIKNDYTFIITLNISYYPDISNYPHVITLTKEVIGITKKQAIDISNYLNCTTYKTEDGYKVTYRMSCIYLLSKNIPISPIK